MRIRFLVAGLATLVALGSAGYGTHQRGDYNKYVDLAINEHGPNINFVYVPQFFRDEPGHFSVAIDADMPRKYSDYVRSVYAFLARVSNRTVDFEMVSAGALMKADRFVYVGSDPSNDVDPHTFQSPFAAKLRSSLSRIYPNENDEIYWSILNLYLPGYYGRPLFFNSDFATMDFKRAQSEKTYSLKSNRIEKAAVYVNVPPIPDAPEQDVERFTKFIIIQEIFQEYNVAPDINGSDFQLKTILNDNDGALLDTRGVETMRGAYNTASSALCPYDVMLTSQLHARPNANPEPVGLLTYLGLYAQAYWYRFTSPSDLFDDRCW
ncbi:hypothetical protein BC374_11230 [Ensifer sp. LC13]|nr:hypothetical protein BC374_11230 [Ensifer sp. LC13]OCP05116.1 hypothetical protein BC362_15315 [Ensifer sp. LC14]OCP14468.1 hypothetical protein BBX50_11505 [Ensifer sp. LC11]OCP29128.1 hypothetical protein BC364_09630 [Ensifer sp. LC499]